MKKMWPIFILRCNLKHKWTQYPFEVKLLYPQESLNFSIIINSGVWEEKQEINKKWKKQVRKVYVWVLAAQRQWKRSGKNIILVSKKKVKLQVKEQDQEFNTVLQSSLNHIAIVIAAYHFVQKIRN